MLYLSDPPGLSRDVRRAMLDDLAALNEKRFEEVGDPEGGGIMKVTQGLSTKYGDARVRSTRLRAT